MGCWNRNWRYKFLDDGFVVCFMAISDRNAEIQIWRDIAYGQSDINIHSWTMTILSINWEFGQVEH